MAPTQSISRCWTRKRSNATGDSVSHIQRPKDATELPLCGPTCSNLSSSVPSGAERTKSSAESRFTPRFKHALLSHPATSQTPQSCYPSPPPSDNGSTKSILRTGAPFSAPSSSSNNSSCKSVQWGQNDSDQERRISPGHYASSTPKRAFKPVLKYLVSHIPGMASLFNENAPILAGSAAIDRVVCDLITCVKSFKCPSELDFFLNSESPMILAKVEKNKSFLDQLSKLLKLSRELDEIQTHGDAQLVDKYEATRMSIGRALSRMEQVQIKLYVKFIDSTLDELDDDIRICIEDFVYPSELGFPENSEAGMILAKTERNQAFIYQLQTLASFRVQLSNIPNYDDEQLKCKRKAIVEIIEQNLHMMKAHQLRLYYRQLTKAPLPRRV